MTARKGILTSVLWLVALVAGAQPLRVGLATGFPPYQYIEDGRAVGLDVELTEAVVREAGRDLVWVQRPWDEVTAILRTSTDLDFVTGMEKTGTRTALFLFSRTLYTRKNLLLTLADGPVIRTLGDLSDRAVAGDRDAFGEVALASLGLKDDVRLVRTTTKEQAFEALVARKVAAAIMPEAVGRTLARKSGVAIRTLDLGDPGSPVGLAFRKDRTDLAALLDAAIERLEKKGTLRVILGRYR